MRSNPKVSICIPSYNHARFLPAALDSALSQTYKNIEIIIVDDGSKDDSLQIAESYAAKHPSSIKVFTHQGHSNLGISATANYAFLKSSGKYWSGLPSDDLLYPDKIERQVAFLEKNQGIGWVYGDAHYIDESGQRLPDMYLFGDISRDSNPMNRLIMGNKIPGMAVLARRECIEKIGFHDQTLIYSDWDFWIRLLAHCKVGFLKRPLVMYRVHTCNTSIGIGAEENLRRELEVLTAIREKALNIGGAIANPRTRALIDLQRSFHFFLLNEISEAAMSFKSALESDPSLHTDIKYLAHWLESLWIDRNFAPWIIQQLSLDAGESSAELLTKRLTGWRYEKAAMERYQSEDFGGTRQMIIRMLVNDPGRLINKHLLSILVETLVGRRLMGNARKLKQKVTGKFNRAMFEARS